MSNSTKFVTDSTGKRRPVHRIEPLPHLIEDARACSERVEALRAGFYAASTIEDLATRDAMCSIAAGLSVATELQIERLFAGELSSDAARALPGMVSKVQRALDGLGLLVKEDPDDEDLL